MYQPLEYVVVDETNRRWSGWRCRIPHCWGEQQGDHGVCTFHIQFAGKQYGDPFVHYEDATQAERNAAYAVWREKKLREIPYHLIMASLWPGPNAEQRAKNAKREKSLKEKWNEERDH